MHNLFLLFFLVYFIRTEKGFEFLSIKEVQATCFSSTYKLIMRLLIHGQGGQKHALEVMSFHPLRGGLAIFSSIYKLVTECFNHSKEGYNMLSRLQVFIHGEGGLHICIHPQAGYGSFQPQTRGPQTRGLRHALEVTSFHLLSDGLHIFSSIYKLVTELFNHRQEG